MPRPAYDGVSRPISSLPRSTAGPNRRFDCDSLVSAAEQVIHQPFRIIRLRVSG